MTLYLTDNGQAMDKMAAFFDGYRACLDDICDRVGAAVIIAAVPVKIGGLPRRRGQEKLSFLLFLFFMRQHPFVRDKARLVFRTRAKLNAKDYLKYYTIRF